MKLKEGNGHRPDVLELSDLDIQELLNGKTLKRSGLEVLMISSKSCVEHNQSECIHDMRPALYGDGTTKSKCIKCGEIGIADTLEVAEITVSFSLERLKQIYLALCDAKERLGVGVNNISSCINYFEEEYEIFTELKNKIRKDN